MAIPSSGYLVIDKKIVLLCILTMITFTTLASTKNMQRQSLADFKWQNLTQKNLHSHPL